MDDGTSTREASQAARIGQLVEALDASTRLLERVGGWAGETLTRMCHDQAYENGRILTQDEPE